MDSRSYDIYNTQKSAYLYACTEAQITTFCSQLTDGTITGFDIQGLFQDSNDYVISIMYLPVNLTNLVQKNNTSENIVLGKSATGIPVTPIDKQKAYYQIGSITITKYFNNYLDFAPYTKLTLYIPFFEKIDIDPSLVYDKSTTSGTIDVYLSLDVISGKMTVYLYRYSTNVLIASKSAQIGVVVPLGKTNEQEQMRNNILQGISLVGSVGAIALGGYSGNVPALAGGLALATKTTATLLQNNVDKLVGYSGMQGSRDGLSVHKICHLIKERPIVVANPDVDVRGKPCMRDMNLSSFTSGYLRVQEIHFDAKGEDIYSDEITEIVQLLKNGVIM